MKNDSALGTLFFPLFIIICTSKAIITPININKSTGPQDNDIHSGFINATNEKNTNIPINVNITLLNVFSLFDNKYEGYTNVPIANANKSHTACLSNTFLGLMDNVIHNKPKIITNVK